MYIPYNSIVVVMHGDVIYLYKSDDHIIHSFIDRTQYR